MKSDYSPGKRSMKFIALFCLVVVVTLYCGFVGLIGGIMICNFIVQDVIVNHSAALSLDVQALLTWGGGAVIGGVPMGYIAVRWIGQKIGWSENAVCQKNAAAGPQT
jgi:hypothetical protein